MKMHFSILFFSVVISLFACKNNNSKTVSSEVSKEISFKGENIGSSLDVFVSTFLKNHPDIENNDVTFENSRKEFAKDFDEKFKLDFLNDMPFSCLNVDRDVATKKISASFAVFATSKDSSYAISVFLDASVDEENSALLKQFTDYKIQGTISKLKNNHISFKKEMIWNPKLAKGWCIAINVFGLKLDLKSFTEIPKSK